MRAIIIILAAVLVQGADPLVAGTLTCSQRQGVTTCSSSDGYTSHESTWNGVISGDDNGGGKWTSWRWRDTTTTTVRPPPER
jgi:hypothetical protein